MKWLSQLVGKGKMVVIQPLEVFPFQITD
jgi:hypothetical protein